jgi:large subunit ribosomal protein L24
MKQSSCLLAHFARYRTPAKFYFNRATRASALRISPDFLSQPTIEKKFRGVYVDEKLDMRDKKNTDLSESLRSPRERDFYQDHTYHEEWEQRDLDFEQSKTLTRLYGFLAPGHAIEPWVWYPGDMVEIVSGPFTGQRGTILTVLKYKNEVMVQNVNVKSITIPASESRPEQVMQREHPISVRCVRHVDPSTNELCDVRLVTVRNRETSALEQRRISMASGVMLPIPKEDPALDGDPLHDTPLHDAEEVTYDERAEMPVLMERKLKAMEQHFVGELKAAHEYHDGLERQNYKEMLKYQLDVVARAEELIVQNISRSLLDEPSENETDLGIVPKQWWFQVTN